MLKFLNRVSPDSTPDGYGSGIDSEVTILLLICIILFSVLLFGGIAIYSYIQNLKERIKELKSQLKTKKEENQDKEE